METLALVLLPALLELSVHRLGIPVRWARVWWVVAVLGALGALLPAGGLASLISCGLLFPALWLAMGAVARVVAARARRVEEDRASWLLGQAAIGVGLLGPVVLGWALLARGMGIDIWALPVSRAIVGVLATGLVGGEMALASGGRWGRIAAVLAMVTAVVSLLPGPWWLFAAALATAAAGLTLRLEVRAALPGAPGTDGLVALAGAVLMAGLALPLPVAAALLGGLALGVTAWLWRHLVVRLNQPTDHSADCDCCAHPA